MPLFAFGLNHTTAPLALRERVAFPSEHLSQALQLLRQQFSGLIAELAIVSTCHRTEIYAVSKPALEAEALHATIRQIQQWFCAYHHLTLREIGDHLYTLIHQDAVRHAFRVASGLDSMVLGEPQILGQMKQAARTAAAAGALGTYLHQLFQQTFSVAKKVRTQTMIGAHSVSLAAAAVRLAQRIFEYLSEQHVLLIGAGEMIELMATHFAAQRPLSITIANRTIERGKNLAARFNAQAILLSELSEQLARFDLVISCTASSLPIIGLGMVERATRLRHHKPMFMVDLAVPRDMEAEIGELDDVFLYTVDDLGQIAASALESRQGAVEQAEALIEQQMQQFMQWLEKRRIVPMIRELHQRADAMRQSELERAQRLLARGEEPVIVLESLAQGLTNKFIHGPTQLLKHSAPHSAIVDLVARLYKDAK